MSSEGQAPAAQRALLVVLAAFATSAALVVLQTVVFKLLPWDGPSSARAALGFRFAFLAADIAMLVAFLALARAAPSLRGFVAVGALLSGFDVVAAIVSGSARMMGNDARALRSMSEAMSAAEPITALAAALLAVLALSALSARRARALVVVLLVSVGLSLAFHVARLVDPGPRSLYAAWVSWSLEVARPLLIAVLALRLARAVKRDAIPTAVDAPGPYRGAGEGPPAPARTGATFGATAHSFRAAAGGLSVYRIGFLAHVACAIGANVFAAGLLAFTRGEAGLLAFLLVPASSVATAAVILVGIGKLRALPRGSATRGVSLGAIVATIFAGLLDLGAIVYGLNAFAFSHTSFYRAQREFNDLMLIEWPLAALLGGLALLLMASALMRISESVNEPALVLRGRWVQGLAVGAGAMQIACVLSMFAVQASRYGYPRSFAGPIVTFAFALTALAASVAVVVLHVLLVGSVRGSLLAHADGPG